MHDACVEVAKFITRPPEIGQQQSTHSLFNTGYKAPKMLFETSLTIES